MPLVKVGTKIDFRKREKRQAKIQQIKDDITNTLFWLALIVVFGYCLFTPQY